MRELKFRLIRDGEIVGYEVHAIVHIDEYGGEVVDLQYWHDSEQTKPIDSVPIHRTKDQFTGLLDKKGVEIYEGDCLGWSGDTIVVLWDNKQGMWCAMSADHEPLAGTTPKVMTFKPAWRAYYEVIGNIHENPELLNG